MATMAMTQEYSSDVSVTEVLQFLANYGLLPGVDYKPISFDRYRKIVQTAAKWHGAFFAERIVGCFMPTGAPVCPGYEDSYSQYIFDFEFNDWLI